MRINLNAPINTLGYGCVGLNVLWKLVEAGHEVALFPIGGIECPQEYREVVADARRRALFYDDAAPSVRIFHQDQLGERVGRGLAAGYPFFELDPLRPGEVHHLNQLDRVLVPSAWAREVCIESGVDAAKIRVVSPGVDSSIFHCNLKVERLDPDQTVFFTVGKWEVRKGHDFLLQAFNKAFRPEDRVVLKMLCDNPVIPAELNEDWRRKAFGTPMGAAGRIQLPRRLARQQDVARFMQAGDIGVFPSHAEGFNLELLEAMAMGKPVIATAYSGHTEFIDSMNASLITTCELESAFDGYFFRGEGRWAKLGPDQEEQMVHHLREWHGRKQRGEDLINEDGIDMGRDFNWDQTVFSLLRAVA